MVTADHDLWVFGYGSLMWRPDFPFIEAHAARLDGWHRCFCIVSRHYRGSDLRPGLVLGLDRGGRCEGRAFRVAAADAAHVMRYLRVREQISGVYREARVSVSLRADGAPRVTAVAYLAEPAHPSYVPRLSVGRQARIIAGAFGRTGSNLDYLLHTRADLARLGIVERELERVVAEIGAVFAHAGRTPRRAAPYPRVIAGWPKRPAPKLSDLKRFIHRRRWGAA
ncbi:MAG: gamma-glutamylcyclotransferase [Hyphomicrobium sp.]